LGTTVEVVWLAEAGDSALVEYKDGGVERVTRVRKSALKPK
jgi:hypothetical protein